MNLFGREIKSNFAKMLAWFIVLTVFAGLLLLFYQIMLDNKTKDLFVNFINTMSPTSKNILGLEEKIEYENLSQYIAFIFQYIAVLVAMFAMQLGAGSLSKEQGTGNIQFIYSSPISRSEIVTQKFLANILTYILFLVLLGAATFGISVAIKAPDINTLEVGIDIIKIFLGMLGTGLVFMSVGFFFSTLAKNNNHAESISVLFVLIMVGLTMFGKVRPDILGAVADCMSFQVFKPIRMLTYEFHFVPLIVNLVIFILFLLLTYLSYNSKELKY